MNAAYASVSEPPEPEWLGRAAEFAVRAMDAAGLSDWDLSLLFCGEAFIAELNKRYRDKDGPTDVLSFEAGAWAESEGGRRYIAGDVVVCPAMTAANAAAFGVGEDEELRRTIVHGILHLAGMDHSGEGPDEPMLARQESLLSALSEERIL